ncbi:MAG TPA: DUF5615 family PIN-like protein [Anaerolineae bacterium]|nr:DUF5615 family PIN-like protein [Anaerolineae bacterium]
MKFIVNAQLPRSLVRWLNANGHDALHTLDLPHGNRSKDAEILTVSISEQRILITKDSDFVDSFIMKREPYKLLLISTGHISNKDLEHLIIVNLAQIASAFEQYNYIELSRTALIYHQ